MPTPAGAPAQAHVKRMRVPGKSVMEIAKRTLALVVVAVVVVVVVVSVVVVAVCLFPFFFSCAFVVVRVFLLGFSLLCLPVGWLVGRL